MSPQHAAITLFWQRWSLKLRFWRSNVAHQVGYAVGMMQAIGVLVFIFVAYLVLPQSEFHRRRRAWSAGFGFTLMGITVAKGEEWTDVLD